MIRAYDKDNKVFSTYDWGYVATVDEIEFNADTVVVEKYNIMDDCEAFIVLNDNNANFSLLLQAKTYEEAVERFEKAIIDGYIMFTYDENPIEVITDAFDIVDSE